MNTHIFNKSNKHTKGQTIAEHSILLVAVAVVLVGVILGPFHDELSDLFDRLIQSISNNLMF